VPFLWAMEANYRGEVEGKFRTAIQAEQHPEAISESVGAHGDRLRHHPGEFLGGAVSCDGFSSWAHFSRPRSLGPLGDATPP